MRYFVHIWSLFIVSFGLAACINSKANADMDLNGDKTYRSISLVGKYEGNLPCADCSAISTTLILNKDRTYSLHYMYVGKSDQQFEKKGNWKIESDVLKLDSEDYSYKILHNKLKQLDLSGKEITGKIAEKYLLTKVD